MKKKFFFFWVLDRNIFVDPHKLSGVRNLTLPLLRALANSTKLATNPVLFVFYFL